MWSIFIRISTKDEIFFKFFCYGCNIYGTNIIVTKFHHLKKSKNEKLLYAPYCPLVINKVTTCLIIVM